VGDAKICIYEVLLASTAYISTGEKREGVAALQIVP